MGKWDELLKVLGHAPDAATDAARALEHVNTPEIATALRGNARAQYLKALDEVHGPVADRAKVMGFGSKDYYHGTDKVFDSFDDKFLGGNTTGVSKKLGHHFSDKPEVANDYAKTLISDESPNVIPVRLKTRGGSAFETDGYTVSPEDVDLVKEQFSKKNAPVLLRDKADALWDPLNKDKIGTVAIVQDPSQIRSTQAAFDPRFKNSPLLMAGGLAGATPSIDNPIDLLKQGVSAYKNWQEKNIAEPLARQLDLSGGKDPQIANDAKMFSSVVADPLNFVDGPIGAALGGLQMMGSDDKEEQAKRRALSKLAGNQ